MSGVRRSEIVLALSLVLREKNRERLLAIHRAALLRGQS